ncbi:hypothetical protein ACSBR1_017272 [Camellia fascicularis]
MMQNHFPQSKATHSLSVYFLNIDQNCARNQNLKKVSCSTVLSLAYQSLGVVYGDLNTSPLYVYKTTFSGKLSLHEDDEKIYGVLSFIFWTFTLIALFKYIFIVISANDNGEGGTFALYSILCRHARLSILPNQQRSDGTFALYSLLQYQVWRQCLLIWAIFPRCQLSGLICWSIFNC